MKHQHSRRKIEPFQRFLFLFFGVPLLLGIFYLALIYSRFWDNPLFVLEHLVVFVFWVGSTFLWTFWAAMWMRPSVRSWSCGWIALGPGLSFYFLFVIYFSSTIGYFSWGDTPTFRIVARFIPELFLLADNFMIPRAVPVLALSLPLILMVGFFQWGKSAWCPRLEESATHFGFFGRKISIIFWAAVFCVFLALALQTEASKPAFGNFSRDPILCFLSQRKAPFVMTPNRIQWAEKDKKIRGTIQRREPRARNILLFIVDALRADHLPAYGYSRPITPFLSSLSRERRFGLVNLALSNGLESLEGILSILTSKEIDCMSHLNYTLIDSLAENGFKVFMYLSGDHHWYNFKNAYGRQIDCFVDGTSHPGPFGINDDQLILDQLKNLPPDDGGCHFFVFHLMSTHEAGVLRKKYTRYQPILNFINSAFRSKDRVSPGEVEQIVNLYDDRVIQADDMIRQIFETLGKKGYLSEYLGAITGDHGQLLGEHNLFGHGRVTYLEVLHVPLIFFGSGQLPRPAQSHFAVQADIAPTLVDMAGLEIPPTWQGQSLLRKRTNPWSYHYSYAGANNWGAVVYYGNGRFMKYSKLFSGNDEPSEFLSDLIKDPEEKENWMDRADPKMLNEMREQAGKHLTGEGNSSPRGDR